MTIETRVHRIVDVPRPTPMIVDLHDPDCSCCRAPTVEPALDAVAIGQIAGVSFMAVSLLFAGVDPGTAAARILALLGLS